MKSGFAFAAILIPGIAILALPQLAGASWPFTVTHADAGSDPVTHDSSLPLLEAPVNADALSTPSSTSNDLTSPDGTLLVPFAGPNGSLPDATSDNSGDSNPSSNAGGGQISTYTVQDGDSLSKIASDHGVSVSTILWANDISNANTIKPGDSLIILPVSGIQYTVKKGDTLSTIAAKYNADAKEIAIFNGISTDTALAAGSDIIIPGGEQQATSAIPTQKSSTKSTSSKTSTKSTSSSASKSTTASDKASLADIKSAEGSTPDAGYFQNPVPGAILTQGIHGNNAVDLGIPTGTPIHAAAAGKVIIAKTDGGWNGGYGNYVVVSHPNGMQTLYAHMSRDVATVGESVSTGEVIGYVGTTGEATGPHVHFEVRGGKNPFGYSCTPMKKCY